MKKRSLFAAAAVVAGSLTAPVVGATLTWTGAAGSLWTNPGSWTGGGVPSATNSSLVFPGGPFVSTFTTDTGVDQVVADLLFNSANAYTINNNSLTFTGGIFTQSGAGTVGINSAVTLGAATAFNVGGATGETAFGGVVSGSGTPSFNGGTSVFTNNASFSGGMNVNAGATIEARGNGSVTIAAGRLTGNGTIVAPAGSPFTVGALATVAPGSSPGVLSVVGGVNLNSGAILNIEINGTTAGTQYDQLNVTGPVNLNADGGLGAILNVTTGFTPALGSTFTIIPNDFVDPVTGIFAGLPQGGFVASGGAGGLFSISYTGGDGNDVVLTAVIPEPAAISALGLAAVGLLGRRHRWFSASNT